MFSAMTLRPAAVLVFGIAAWTAQNQPERRAWQAPPRQVRSEASNLTPSIREAMETGDEAKVRAVVARLRGVLGEWAGRTEVETKYHTPVNAGPPPSLGEIRAGWDALFQSTEGIYKGRGQWLHSGPVPLRETGEFVVGIMDALKAGAGDRDLELRRVREGLDYLLSVQAPNGFFPFPDMRGKDPFFGPMVERAVAKSPDVIANGWMVKDAGDGGLQFDNGVCGFAMLEGYAGLHDRRYLDAARRASDWAVAQPLAANFNYNSFSVWLLARFFEETHERKYLDAALQKLRVGVLPGEMENGRWVDLHNARPAYHWIMIRAMTKVYEVLPAKDTFRSTLRSRLVSAVDNGAREIRENGAPSFESSLGVLPKVCRALTPQPEWVTALNVLINGVFDEAHRDPANVHGISPYGYGSYLLYRSPQKR